MSGACGEIAWRIHERTGWPVVLLTSTGEGWVHAAVALPDGTVLDGTGRSQAGTHILDNDMLYGLFDADELEASDGEVRLVPMPSPTRELLEWADADRARCDRIADELLEWANAPHRAV